MEKDFCVGGSYICFMLPLINQLRKDIHQHPELSGGEAQTARRIEAFIREHYDTEILTGLGGHGLAAVYTFSTDGPTVVIRCELDALPIEEANGFGHRSVHPGVSHKCGHDGHMAIVAGLAPWLRKQHFKKGRVVLLFQPSEETGRGADAVLKDDRFRKLAPKYVFALHNLPGEERGTIIVKDGVFTATVQSVAVHLQGKVAHASEPENGINPAHAMAQITNGLATLAQPDIRQQDFALLTPVYSQLGEKAYGISAGSGELHYTLRTWSEERMQELKNDLLSLAETVCKQYRLQWSTQWFDYFPAVVNHPECSRLIEEVGVANNLPLVQRTTPFKFGDDFGWFSKEYTTALFGLGAGTDMPALHHNDYDFPDVISETGIRMFSGIISRLLEA